ncbi:hypothetical protein RB25_26075 [Herbaspirillum rubrisubalbicans]|uniref:P-loop NTPase fold protein n=1 Tax=Herbaspirillum rubrisubalbicans TaxID=80842 RepID=UPI000DC2AB24|nr:P-loop NTPase fold protein [Herbaspirillum rubrisubalbicans]RAN42336.1 hypothetical protein RB25_26075 [Herbaspirillum rubrisubalbicans]
MGSIRGSKILKDSPADLDAFGSKGHERTAKALADALQQLQGTDGAIGLEGTWGAGKSTVIKIAENQLSSLEGADKKYEIFTFDLWAHQSDDFRRAYLENFLAWLESKNMLPQAKLEQARDAIRDRVKSIKVESSKTYNIFGIAFILLLPVLPLMYAWLGPSAISPTNGHAPPISGLTKSLLIGAFVLLYGSGLLRLAQLTLHWKRWLPEYPFRRQRIPFLKALSSAVSIFSRDVESETTTQNIRESDPTTIEFHRIFRDLLADAQVGGKVIIHVLDNIDRIPKGAVPDTWSEMRALFAIRGGPSTRENDQVLMVLPYDKKFVMSAFEIDGDTEHADKEADFIEKTFSRTLRVAPPISNDWRDFFFQKMEESFGESISTTQNERLFRLLRLSFQKTTTHASPRRIIHFVNELGSLSTQWDEVIPIEACAVYILNRTEIERTANSLQQANLIDERYTFISEVADLHRQLAALSFNVPPESAYQVLLNAPVTQALIGKDEVALKNLSEVPGFMDVLQDVLQEQTREWKGQPEILANICRNLATLEFSEGSKSSIWRGIAADLHSFQGMLEANVETISAFAIAVSMLQVPTERQRLAAKIQQLVDPAPKALVNYYELSEYGKKWFASIYALQETIKKTVSDEAAALFAAQTVVSLRPEIIFGAAEDCIDRAPYLFSHVFKNVTAHEAPIEDAYVSLIEADANLAQRLFSEVRGYFDEDKRARFLETVLTRLQRSTLTSDAEIALRASLLSLSSEIVQFMYNWNTIRSKLASSQNDGTLAWHAYHAYNAKDVKAAADAIGLMIAAKTDTSAFAGSNGHPTFGPTMSQAAWANGLFSSGIEDEEFLTALCNTCKGYISLDVLRIRGLKTETNSPLYKQMLTRVISTLNFRQLNAYSTICAYPEMKPLVSDDDAVKFLRRLADWPSALEFSEDKPVLKLPTLTVSDIVRHASDTKLRGVIDEVDKKLKQATQEEWEEALREESDLVRLVIVRQKEEEVVPSLAAFKPALETHAREVLAGEYSVETYTADWKYVVGSLPAFNQGLVANDLLLHLAKNPPDTDGLVEFVTIYEKLTEKMNFSAHADISLNQIFTRLVVRTEPAAVQFIDANVHNIQATMESASEEARGAFEEAVLSLASVEEGTSGRERGILLAQRFGFEIPDESNSSEEAGSE